MSSSVVPQVVSPGGKCVVIDSRISSRKEIVECIEAQQLFDEIVIASSIINAIQKMRRSDFEACVIGTSIDDEVATSFVKEAKEFSGNCAFVAIRDNRTELKSVEEAMDSVLTGEVTPLKLAMRVSQAMVKASEEPEQWKAYFRQSLDHLKAEEEQESVSRLKESSKNTDPGTVIREQKSELEHILQKLSEGLFHLQRGYSEKIYNLDAFAIPSPETVRAIKDITRSLFEQSEQTAGTVELKRTFEKFLIQWFVDMAATNAEQATRKLRVKLVQELRT